MQLRRVLQFASVFAVAAYWIFRITREPVYRLDLEILVLAASRMLEGTSQYLVDGMAENTKPPLAAWLFQGLVPWSALQRGWFWDAFQVVAAGSLGLFVLGREWLKIALGLLLTYGVWQTETLLGQYNVILVAILALTGQWLSHALVKRDWATNWAESGGWVVLGGVAFWEVMIKPTQILMLPCFLPLIFSRGQRYRESVGEWSANVKTLVLLCFIPALAFLGYGSQLGWDRLIADHREWVGALAASEARHIGLFKNFGFPGFITQHFGYYPVLSRAFLVAGFALVTGWMLRLERDFSTRAVFVGVSAALLFSPMAWKQNITPLLLILNFEALRSRESWMRLRVPVGLGILFQVLSIDTLGEWGYRLYCRSGAALTLVLLVVLLALKAGFNSHERLGPPRS